MSRDLPSTLFPTGEGLPEQLFSGDRELLPLGPKAREVMDAADPVKLRARAEEAAAELPPEAQLLQSRHPMALPNGTIPSVPNLPLYAKELGLGLIKGATLGTLDVPVDEDDETSPAYFARSVGTVLGLAFPYGSAFRIANVLGAGAKTRAAVGAGLGLIEEHHRQVEDPETSAWGSMLVIAGGAVAGALTAPRIAAQAPHWIQLKDPKAQQLVNLRMRQDMPGLPRHMRNLAAGALPKSARQAKAPFTADIFPSEEREMWTAIHNFGKAVPNGPFNLDDLVDAGRRMRAGKVLEDFTIPPLGESSLRQMMLKHGFGDAAGSGTLGASELHEVLASESTLKRRFGLGDRAPSPRTIGLASARAELNAAKRHAIRTAATGQRPKATVEEALGLEPGDLEALREGRAHTSFKRKRDLGRATRADSAQGAGLGATTAEESEEMLRRIIEKTRRTLEKEPNWNGIRPFEKVMAELQEQTGVPYWDEVFKPVEEARYTIDNISKKWDKLANATLKGAKKKHLDPYMRWLTPDSPADRAAIARTLTPVDIRRLERLRSEVLDPLFRRWGLGKDSREYLEEVYPLVRRLGGTKEAAELILERFPEKVGRYGPMLRLAHRHELGLNEKNVANFVASHIRGGFWLEYGEGVFKNAERVLRKRAGTVGMQIGGDYLRRVRGTNSNFVSSVGKLYQRLWQAMGKDMSLHEAEGIVDTFSNLTHTGLLGFRPASLIRNMLGGWQVGAVSVGPGWYLKGMRQAMTPQGQAFVMKYAKHIKEQSSFFDELRSLANAGTARGRTGKLAHVAMWAYGKADEMTRAHVWLGQYARTQAAIKSGVRTEADFITKAALWNTRPSLRREIIEAWKAGHAHDAARLAADRKVIDTQWAYSQGYRPSVLQSGGGRVAGMFGIWPSNYLEFIREIAFLDMPKPERRKLWAKLLLTNGSIVAAFGLGGAAVGLGSAGVWRTLPWTFVGPLSYAGGPVIDIVQAANRTAFDLMVHPVETLQGKSQGARDLIRAGASVVPFSQVASDISKIRGRHYMGFGEKRKTGGPKGIPEAKTPLEAFFRFASGMHPTGEERP